VLYTNQVRELEEKKKKNKERKPLKRGGRSPRKPARKKARRKNLLLRKNENKDVEEEMAPLITSKSHQGARGSSPHPVGKTG